MSSVSFDENLPTRPAYNGGSGRDGMIVRILYKLGLAKDIRNANTVLVVVAIITTIIAVFVLVTTPGILPGTGEPEVLTPGQMKERAKQLRESNQQNTINQPQQ